MIAPWAMPRIVTPDPSNSDRKDKSMKSGTRGIIGRTLVGCVAAGALMAGTSSGAATAPPTPISAETGAQAPDAPGQGQPQFDSDTAVESALLAAVKAQDHDQVHRLLGPAWKELMSGDKVEDANAFKEFADRVAERSRLEKEDDSTSILHAGNDDWPFPIPIARTDAGKWFLDTETGKVEILARRIGKDELEAIQTARVYVDAQRDYDSKDRDGSGTLKYAQRILSTPGKMDGLYWSVPDGQPPSPFGRLIAQAKLEGYDPVPGRHKPYLGYHFRVLTRQGPSAPGGKLDYVSNGKMTGGFALVAFPAEYEASGIMTFVVGQRGDVYQKDLGADTAALARKLTEFDPDSSWTLVKD
jgi:hypothetical protein